jgi:hypothetical protein
MILATHGIVGSSIVQFVPDSDAAAFFDRVTTAGGTLSNTEKLAVNQLVLDMKDDGIWTKMKAIYPMVGASAAACAQNLKSSSFTGTFNGGWTFSSNGVTGNGSNGFMETNLSSNTSLARDSVSLSIYARTSGTDGDIGDKTIAGGFCGMFNGTSFVGYLGDLNNVSVSQANVIGFFTISRSNLTQVNFYKNGSALGTNPKNSNAGSLNTGTLVISRANTSYSNKQNAFASIGDGLTSTEASNFYTAVQAFQTTLGRQI